LVVSILPMDRDLLQLVWEKLPACCRPLLRTVCRYWSTQIARLSLDEIITYLLANENYSSIEPFERYYGILYRLTLYNHTGLGDDIMGKWKFYHLKDALTHQTTLHYADGFEGSDITMVNHSSLLLESLTYQGCPNHCSIEGYRFRERRGENTPDARTCWRLMEKGWNF